MYLRRFAHDWINLSSNGIQDDDNDDTDSKFLNKDFGARNPNFALIASRFEETMTPLGVIDVLPCDFVIVGVFILIDRMIVMFQLAVESGVTAVL